MGEVWTIKAKGWPKRRRINPTVVRAVVSSYSDLARAVLWLETMGYRCEVHRFAIPPKAAKAPTS